MKKITSIVVDDIPEALEMLCRDLEHNFSEIEIIGKASSVIEAAKLLHKKQPDILFLDIMLGDGTGFDILEIVPNLQSKIIFVTASDEFAIKAFKFAAIDYILKPYSNEDLANSTAPSRTPSPSSSGSPLLHNPSPSVSVPSLAGSYEPLAQSSQPSPSVSEHTLALLSSESLASRAPTWGPGLPGTRTLMSCRCLNLFQLGTKLQSQR